MVMYKSLQVKYYYEQIPSNACRSMSISIITNIQNIEYKERLYKNVHQDIEYKESLYKKHSSEY